MHTDLRTRLAFQDPSESRTQISELQLQTLLLRFHSCYMTTPGGYSGATLRYAGHARGSRRRKLHRHRGQQGCHWSSSTPSSWHAQMLHTMSRQPSLPSAGSAVVAGAAFAHHRECAALGRPNFFNNMHCECPNDSYNEPRRALSLINRTRLVARVSTRVYFFLEYPLSIICLLYTSPSPRDQRGSRMPSSA